MLSKDLHWPVYHPFRSPQAQTQFLLRYEARARQWPVPSTTQFCDGAYGRTYVRISGALTAPPLVLLHGINNNALSWMANIEVLSAHFRVFAIDHIYDCGRSVYSRPLLCVDDHMAWLDELLGTLGLERDVSLAGLSHGGWLALQYALRQPQRLAKLVLLAPVGGVLPLAPQWIIRALLSALPTRYLTYGFLRWLLRDLATTMPELFATVVKDGYIALRCFSPRNQVAPTVATDSEWHNLAVPTLFLVGEHEKIYDPLHAIERLHRVAPQLQTRLIAGAGHDLTIVKAAQINRELCAFLGR